mmetsp:Transcript_2975/g.7848  ORF Transcript_2975/g.7848 Transcript_2975/m.7848 type:complete len:246 (+) Transcript_2975:628-1365(+)
MKMPVKRNIAVMSSSAAVITRCAGSAVERKIESDWKRRMVTAISASTVKKGPTNGFVFVIQYTIVTCSGGQIAYGSKLAEDFATNQAESRYAPTPSSLRRCTSDEGRKNRSPRKVKKTHSIKMAKVAVNREKMSISSYPSCHHMTPASTPMPPCRYSCCQSHSAERRMAHSRASSTRSWYVHGLTYRERASSCRVAERATPPPALPLPVCAPVLPSSCSRSAFRALMRAARDSSLMLPSTHVAMK